MTFFNKLFLSQYDFEFHPFAFTGTGTPAFTFGSTSFSSITDNGVGDYSFSLKNSRAAGIRLWCFAYAIDDTLKLYAKLHDTGTTTSAVRIQLFDEGGIARDAKVAGLVIVKRSAREV